MISFPPFFAVSAILAALATDVSAASGGSGSNWRWSLCDTDVSYPVQVDSIQIVPDKPVRGQSLSVISNFVTSESIVDGAYVNATLQYRKLHIPGIFDLCHTKQDGFTSTVSCPVAPGPFTVKFTTIVDPNMPSGHYGSHAVAYNADDSVLFCVDINVDF